ncbi:MAG TPA: flagellar hook-associated protein FlgK, partial [Bacteroidetes bacterium]|nr:flagellar hook-associated protein FlgK [Bacteroidota bacterium]
MGIFGILSLGRQGIFASQFGLNTASNNISNANTPGYSRQRVNFVPAYPQYTGFGPLGNGVDVASVQRLRDRALDFQLWGQKSLLGNSQASEKYLQQIEAVFNEVNGDGLSGALDGFWNSWLELSNHPSDMISRSQVIEKTNVLVGQFHQKSSRLQALSRSVSKDAELTLAKVNTLAQQIADLNNKIVQTAGNKFNNITLMDKRDQLIDQLSGLIDVNVSDGSSGTVGVNIGSMSLVDGVTATPLELDQSGAKLAVKFKNGAALESPGGEIGALLSIKNNIISHFQSKLDDFAKNLVTSVNTLHQKYYGLDGSSGRDYFDPNGISADAITLSQTIANDAKKIGVSSDGSIGDNSGALALARLKDETLMNSGASTFSDFYGQLITDIGEKSSQATMSVSENQSLVQALNTQRQSVMGV